MTEQTMELGTTDLTVIDLSELLFCSSLQPSDDSDLDRVLAALRQSLHSHHGTVRECAEELAASYGDDPEITCLRMRWARSVIYRTFPTARLAS
ncbi:MAG TPA: hypothetical protein VMZ00_11655 [Sporichthya sp.]|nr:hypothetical protein [Sporichthya sp.]